MEEINIKKHPPWYARGTPVTNNRDGPAMALSDTPLIVIRRKSSASGAEEEGGVPMAIGSVNALMRECVNEDRSRKLEDGSRNPEASGGIPPLADVINNPFQHEKQRV